MEVLGRKEKGEHEREWDEERGGGGHGRKKYKREGGKRTRIGGGALGRIGGRKRRSTEDKETGAIEEG